MAYAFLLIIAAALPKSLGLKITAEEEQTSGNLLWTCFFFTSIICSCKQSHHPHRLHHMLDCRDI